MGPNEEAVAHDLKRLTDPKLAEGALAQMALTLARGLDSDSSLTSKAMASKALIDTMNRLWELAPAKKETDEVDEFTSRRKARRAKAAG